VPRTTLTARYNGVPTRRDGHAHELNLAPAEELVLVDWIKVMGRCGIPLTHEMVAQHATVICRETVGDAWVRRFIGRHQD
ncbi:hypothetical protein BDN72DRAFT_743930, partial [Pluteus cervinus]